MPSNVGLKRRMGPPSARDGGLKCLVCGKRTKHSLRRYTDRRGRERQGLRCVVCDPMTLREPQYERTK